MRHPLTPDQQRLGAQMDRYWAAFARTGDPNAPGQVPWPKITTSGHPVLGLHPTGNAVSTAFPVQHQCDFWATLTGG